MADVVAVHRLIVGKGEERKAIAPGTRFDTGEYDIDAETLERWQRSGTVREPRDQQQEGQREMTPRERSRQGQVVEGRSGQVQADVPIQGQLPTGSQTGGGVDRTNPAGAQAQATGETNAGDSPRRRRGDADL